MPRKRHDTISAGSFGVAAFGQGASASSQQSAQAANQLELMVPMRDGVKLATGVFLPDGPEGREGNGRWPVVLTARLVDRTGKGIRSAPRDALIADVTPLPAQFRDLLAEEPR